MSFFRSGLIVLLLFLGLAAGPVKAQTPGDIPFFQPADSLHQGRFWTCVAGGSAVYGGVSLALWHSWYQGYELGPFHWFNDWGEWEHMDKWGHILATYHEANWVYRGALWTGMKRRNAIWTGVGVGMLLQSTIEVMDGFSVKWGFSWYDMAFNALGAGVFAGQEFAWNEQRITIKLSNTFPNYPDDRVWSEDGSRSMTLDQRAVDLFGGPGYQRFFKDYNGMSVWFSANLHSFMPRESRFPKWLNLALGYSVGNVYAGYGYEWEKDGALYRLDPLQYPRHGQFLLSPDIDFKRIPTRSLALKALFGALNFIKIPAPALEVTTLGRVRMRAIYW